MAARAVQTALLVLGCSAAPRAATLGPPGIRLVPQTPGSVLAWVVQDEGCAKSGGAPDVAAALAKFTGKRLPVECRPRPDETTMIWHAGAEECPVAAEMLNTFFGRAWSASFDRAAANDRSSTV